MISRNKYNIIKMLTLVLFMVSGIINYHAVADFKQPRGTTHTLIHDQDLTEVGIAPTYTVPDRSAQRKLFKPDQITGALQETNNLDLYLPAGSHLAVRYDDQNKTLEFIEPGIENPFNANVLAAIDKAPNWIENDLINVFSLLEPAYRDKWANAILDAEDPFIDEIAFCIAHLSPQYLMSGYAYVELLNLNARLVYQNDEHLDYVKVVDYGSSETDPDYYSTTIYRKAKYIDTLEIEVPRDIYYWYIVHPKITDEIPAFVDPDIVEYTHKENITDPDNGYFWRDFLFYEADPGYAKFIHMIKGCKIVWNQFGGGVVPGSHAIEVMNRWQGGCLQFTSENDRPHQPVRIYRKHMGRCGENSDMRVAIARSALIPAASVGTYSRDHVWNEFWDEEWIHWDGSIDNPMMYVDNWGKELNSIFRWRSDGSFTCVTDRYTRDYATLNLYAVDKMSNPIDGARILLYAPGLYQPKAFDNYAVTDADGKVSFIVSAGRTYWAKMQCDYGNVPSDQDAVLRVVGSSQHGETYNVALSIDAENPPLYWEDIAVPQTNDGRYFLDIQLESPTQIIQGRNLIDDLRMNAYQFIGKDGGKVNFFMTDESNYQDYCDGQQFQGFYSRGDTGSIGLGFEFAEGLDWYGVLDNSSTLHTLQHITGTVALYSVYDPEIADVQVISSFPNPMSSQSSIATIEYVLPRKSKIEINIYNILGQKIRTLVNEIKYAGQFSTSWDGKNELGQQVTSGSYLCTIKTSQGTASRKIMVLH